MAIGCWLDEHLKIIIAQGTMLHKISQKMLLSRKAWPRLFCGRKKSGKRKQMSNFMADGCFHPHNTLPVKNISTSDMNFSIFTFRLELS